MHVVVVEGYLGAGKTLGMTLLAKYLESCSNGVLYSNFGVKGAKQFTSLKHFLTVAADPSSIVMLDEAHIDLDSRSFSSNHVKFVSQTSFYLRKMRCTLMLTSPLYENLDSRIRGITNILVRVSKDKRYFYYEFYDIQSERYLKSFKVRQDKAFLLDLYDTNTIVTPLEVPEKKPEFDRFLEELKHATDEYYRTDGTSKPSRLARFEELYS